MGRGFRPHAEPPQPAFPRQVSGCAAGRRGLGVRPEIGHRAWCSPAGRLSEARTGSLRLARARARQSAKIRTRQAPKREGIMTPHLRDFLLLVVLTAAATTAFGQTVATDTRPAAKSAAASVPDFSGIWAHPFLTGFEPPASGPGPVLNRSR